MHVTKAEAHFAMPACVKEHTQRHPRRGQTQHTCCMIVLSLEYSFLACICLACLASVAVDKCEHYVKLQLENNSNVLHAKGCLSLQIESNKKYRASRASMEAGHNIRSPLSMPCLISLKLILLTWLHPCTFVHTQSVTQTLLLNPCMRARSRRAEHMQGGKAQHLCPSLRRANPPWETRATQCTAGTTTSCGCVGGWLAHYLCRKVIDGELN